MLRVKRVIQLFTFSDGHGRGQANRSGGSRGGGGMMVQGVRLVFIRSRLVFIRSRLVFIRSRLVFIRSRLQMYSKMLTRGRN